MVSKTLSPLGSSTLSTSMDLFLDEVGEIPLHLQGKLLRVLQEHQFERIGDITTRKVDVRIIAATNKDLKQQVNDGLFREDLFFRLNVFPIESVPLRHKREDIPLLTQHFLQRACVRANKPLLKIPLGEMTKLQQYHWPGNIRELENEVERYAILAQGDTIRFDGFLIDSSEMPAVETVDNTVHVITDTEIRQQQKQTITRALGICQGKAFGPGGAAEMLDMKPTTLASRIKKYRINHRDFKRSSQL